MEEHRLQERGARSWHGSVHMWLDTASGVQRPDILLFTKSHTTFLSLRA